MQTIMVVLLEESEDVSEDLLLVLLSVLGRNKKVSTSVSLYLHSSLYHFFITIVNMPDTLVSDLVG